MVSMLMTVKASIVAKMMVSCIRLVEVGEG